MNMNKPRVVEPDLGSKVDSQRHHVHELLIEEGGADDVEVDVEGEEDAALGDVLVGGGEDEAQDPDDEEGHGEDEGGAELLVGSESGHGAEAVPWYGHELHLVQDLLGDGEGDSFGPLVLFNVSVD